MLFLFVWRMLSGKIQAIRARKASVNRFSGLSVMNNFSKTLINITILPVEIARSR